MDNKEILKKLLQSGHCSARAMLDDITDDETMQTGSTGTNHIRWQTGHLIYSAKLIFDLLGKPIEFSDEWRNLFAGGSTLSDNPDTYPPFETLRSQLYELHDKMIETLDGVSGDDLTVTVKLDGKWDTVPIHGIAFLSQHDYYHLGQIAIVRKALGRERTFG